MRLQQWGRRWMSMANSSSVENARRRFPCAVDAHCHLHDPRLRGHVQDVIQRAEAWNITHVATCACHEEDWDALEQLISTSTGSASGVLHGDDSSSPQRLDIIPSFGIHPWWADAKAPHYLERLRTRLGKYPNALLGEIGLCKSARGKRVDRAIQEQVFREQLELAVELQRTCVIHCVGTYGKLLEILQQSVALPPVVILHSFSGAANLVAPFLALKRKAPGHITLFFSLNARQLASCDPPFINNRAPRKLSKAEDVCLKVPLDALLLETDAPDQPPSLETASDWFGGFPPACLAEERLNEPAFVQLALQRAAGIRQMPVVELAAIVYDNSRRAFRL